MDIKEQRVFLHESNGSIKVKNFRGIWSNVTLEPFWFGIVCSFMISTLASKNYYLTRACTVDLKHSDEVCHRALAKGNVTIELESQRVISTFLTTGVLVCTAINVVVALFLAPWSDVSGRRRPLILLSVIAMICGHVGILMTNFFPDLSAKWVIYAYTIPIAFGGQLPFLFLATFNYLGDICFKSGRCTVTIIGSNSGFIALFMVLATVLISTLLKVLTLTKVFILCCMLELSSLVYAAIMVKDVNISENKHRIFSLDYPIQTLKCVFRKREGFKRRNIFLGILVPSCNTVLYHTDIALLYLYTRNKFSWGPEECGTFLATRYTLYAIGAFVVIAFKKKFNMRDRHIGILGGVSLASSNIIMMMSRSANFFFMSTVFGILSRGVTIAERAVLYKQIGADEQGKVSCVTAITEKILTFLVLPLINYVYSKTLHTYPESIFAFQILLAFVQIVCFAMMKSNIILNDTEHIECSSVRKVI